MAEGPEKDQKEDGISISISDAALGKAVRNTFEWLARLPVTKKTIAWTISLIVIGVGSFLGGHASSNAASDTDPAGAKISTSGPSAKVSVYPSSTAVVTRCYTAQGDATVSNGEGILIVVEGLSPTVYYLEGMARPKTDQTTGSFDWYFPASIGGSTAPGDTFVIYALVLTPQMTDFMQSLENATTLTGDLWTQAVTTLPAYLAINQQTVQRDSGRNELTC